MNLLLILLALAGVAAGLYIARSRRWPGLALLGAATTLALYLATQNFRPESADVRTLIAAVTSYSEVAGIKLARFAASTPGVRVLILLPPGPLGTAEQALRQAFRKELASRVTLVGETTLKMPEEYRQRLESSVTNMPEQNRAEFIRMETEAYGNWMDLAVIEAVIREWSGRADLILWLANLPPSLSDLPPAVAPAGPKLLAVEAKLLTVNADPRLMKSLLQRGLVAAAVVANPKADPWSLPAQPPADVDRAFAQRFLLMTADTAGASSLEPMED